jgi:hypothetical protein
MHKIGENQTYLNVGLQHMGKVDFKYLLLVTFLIKQKQVNKTYKMRF